MSSIKLSHQPRFSAFILRDTGRRIHGSERPMLDYELTASTRKYPLDAVILETTTGQARPVGQSDALANLAKELDDSAITRQDYFLDRTRTIIRNEVSRWETFDDLSQRQRLLQGCEQALQQQPDGAWSMTFVKPAKN